ncbi:hypothetical protein AB0442_08030 [Kitasatospora sp. NPDC085895]|uniref:type II toxin-antitoxin system RelE family toxin n=1 Tax=Kitasatospora sp. NPDC085895 TaxID=3155057 RepID=UPI00344C22E7
MVIDVREYRRPSRPAEDVEEIRLNRLADEAEAEGLDGSASDALRILRRLTELQQALDDGDTVAFDIKALRGHGVRRRLRVGDHRIVHTVDDGRPIVRVLAAGNLRDTSCNWAGATATCPAPPPGWAGKTAPRPVAAPFRELRWFRAAWPVPR